MCSFFNFVSVVDKEYNLPNGTILIYREHSIPVHKKGKPLNSPEQRRVKQDENALNQALSKLTQEGLPFNNNNLKVLYQPDYINQSQLYLESLKDIVSFIVSISNKTEAISGNTIIQRLRTILPILEKKTIFYS
jgi:hypothetical protein